MQNFDAGRVPSITFGVGRLDAVPGIAAGLGGGPVLVVADKVLDDLGVTARLEAGLAGAGLGCEMAAEIAGEPKEAHVDAMAARARETGCRVVIGLGGGAAMDAAKLVAGIAGADRSAAHYALAANPFPATGLPAIAIPTTAGTGSEVTRTAIVSTADGLKYWYWGEELMFAHAVLDPELTLSLPARITAWTGLDAVAHALEAITSANSSPVGRLYGIEALRILRRALPRAVQTGDDIAARGDVLWAATVAGLALHNCNTHMGHNISHALGSLAPVHHGLATALGLAVALPWLVDRPEGAANYALAAAALGGSENPADLPGTFVRLMQDCAVSVERPAACDGIDAAALAAQMKAPANFGMSQNAACPVSEADLDMFAHEMMALPAAELAA